MSDSLYYDVLHKTRKMRGTSGTMVNATVESGYRDFLVRAWYKNRGFDGWWWIMVRQRLTAVCLSMLSGIADNPPGPSAYELSSVMIRI